MATTKNITMKQFNGTDYDTLYPKTVAAQIDDVYSKDDCLTNSTKTAYGLGSSAVPNSIFATARTLIQNAQDTADSKCLVETGSYVGTGTYGSDNPCSITLSFTPKFVVIAGIWGIGFYLIGSSTMWVIVYSSSYSDTRTDVSSLPASTADNTIQWHTSSRTTTSGKTSDSAQFQLNESGITYKYVAFG